MAVGAGREEQQEGPVPAQSRWAATGYVLRLGAESLILGLATLIAVYWAYGLWRHSLTVPIQPLEGDHVIAAYITKALGEGRLLHNPRVGAPFGLDYGDFDQPDILHQAILILIQKFGASAVLAENLFYLLGFVLTAAAAYFVLRLQCLSRLSSAVAALLYTLLPVHFLRGESHLFLSVYWTVPPLIYLVLRIMNGGDSNAFRMLRWAIPLSILVGAGGFYYCFFSLMCLSLAGIYALFAPGGRRSAGVAGFCIVVTLVSLVACLGPMITYSVENGPNPQVGKRTSGETEQYGLKIADLFLPSPLHRSLTLRRITEGYDAAVPWLHENESRSVSLGVLGSAGCLILLVCAVAEFRRRPLVLHQLGILNLGCILFATTSGFGALFSRFITPEIRAQNRVGVFLAFFSLAAVAVCADSIILSGPASRRPWLRGFLIVLLLCGIYDEVPGELAGLPVRAAADSGGMHAFLRGIEERLSPGSMVLQLPFVAYPEMPLRRIDAYDPLRAYLFSSTLRFSFPTMRFRTGDKWLEELCSLPVPELIPQAIAAGYRGLYIDRWGYADNAAGLDAQLRAALQSSPLESQDGRLFFFGLEQVPERWTMAAQQASLLIPVWYLPGFSSEEHGAGPEPNTEWRWCSQRGTMVLMNLTSSDLNVVVSFRALAGVARESKLAILTKSGSRAFAIGASAQAISIPVTLRPGQSKIEFSTDAPRLLVPGETRDLRFRIEHVVVSDVSHSH